MTDVDINNNKITNKINIDFNNKEKTFYEKIRQKFSKFVFNDSDILIKLLYHKYFHNEIYQEIQKINLKNFSDIKIISNLNDKIFNNLIYPSKELCEEKLKQLDINEFIDKKDLIEFYEIDKFSKEYLIDYIKIYKFVWTNNFTNFCFFTCFGLYAFIFKIHKRKKKLSNNLIIIISIQMFLNGLSLYHSLYSHPRENYLKKIYSEELQKYKLIFRE
jgi:hypothetical protein